MIKNYDFKSPCPTNVEFTDCQMHFPHAVLYAVELDDRVIVHLNVNKGLKPHSPDTPTDQKCDTRNIWCYRKPTPEHPDGEFLWKVQPPVLPNGQPHPLPYYNLRYWKERDIICASSLYLSYEVDPENGHITFIHPGKARAW